MFEKTTRINLLFDFYQALLTEKQKAYISYYYLDDYSLGEIADEFEVSRQAVYDNIKRTEETLENYEKKLGMLKQYLARETLLEELTNQLETKQALTAEITTLLDKLKNMD